MTDNNNNDKKKKEKHNQYYSDGTPKLSSSQRKKAVIIAVAVCGAIAFMMWGVTSVVKPEFITVHGSVVTYHWHTTLNVIDDNTGKKVELPGDIGNLNIARADGSMMPNPRYLNRTLDSIGTPGYSPVHTHRGDNVIHLEPSVDRLFTLGDFLNVWGDPVFNGRAGTLTVQHSDGTKTVETDYRGHILRDGEMLTLELEKQELNTGFVPAP